MTSAERKARKAFDGLGLKEQPGFKRVIINYGRQAALQIDAPSVHRLPSTDYWVVFGVAAPVDVSRSAEAARSFSLAGAGAPPVAPVAADAAADASADAAADAPAAAASDASSSDATPEELARLPEGILAKDIDFVAKHAGVSRDAAIEALIKHKSVVPAAMSFSE